MAQRFKNPTVEALLVDCAIRAGRGIGNRTVEQGAINLWAAKYKKAFATQLATNPDWKKDRPTVLLQGLKLGRKARELADKNKGKKRRVITRGNASRASRIISRDPKCPPQPGAGKYCPPA